MTQPLVSSTPITILSGFLGSGKTTLLNHILNGDHGLKLAVLVNDFGDINIDSELIVGVDGDTISLSNGCICCSIRSDLIDAIIRIVSRADRPDHILIETSGVSDPVAVAMSFRTPQLQYFVTLDSIITLVDAEHFLTLAAQDEALAVAQLAVADLVLLNKVDTVSDSELAAVRDRVMTISPRAHLLETSYGVAPLAFLLATGRFDPLVLHDPTALEVHVHRDDADDHDHAHTLAYSTMSWTSTVPLALDPFRELLQRLPATVYRGKGVLYLQDIPEHRAVFHLVGKRAELTLAEVWQGPPRSQIVFIGAHGSLDAEALRVQLDNCTFGG